MAEKEATVYIVDVGKSMGERRHGRSVTDLDWAMQYVWDKITTTVRMIQVIDDEPDVSDCMYRWPLAGRQLQPLLSPFGQMVSILMLNLDLDNDDHDRHRE